MLTKKQERPETSVKNRGAFRVAIGKAQTGDAHELHKDSKFGKSSSQDAQARTHKHIFSDSKHKLACNEELLWKKRIPAWAQPLQTNIKAKRNVALQSVHERGI